MLRNTILVFFTHIFYKTISFTQLFYISRPNVFKLHFPPSFPIESTVRLDPLVLLIIILSMANVLLIEVYLLR